MPNPDKLMDGAQRVADQMIGDAMRRGEFDNLEGAGKPIEGIDQPYDPWWWVKKKIIAEQIRMSPQQAQVLRELSDKRL
ncbi:MAG: DUF1992 domain-containing protein [Phycisphaera sp.]|nr:DUF1992 domain-containing protein [Phycisphaera sp.]